LVLDAGEKRVQQIDLSTGTSRTSLPRSLPSEQYDEHDSWTASVGGYVRRDVTESLTFFDPLTEVQTGKLDPESIPGNDLPEFQGLVRLSPDGNFLLTYFRLNYRSDFPIMTVMRRDGTIVQSGSSYEYDRFWHRYLIDWLPDGGRYVYMAGEAIVLSSLSEGVISHTPITLPTNVTLEGGSLRASPDGKRLLLALGNTIEGTVYTVLFTINIDGTGLRQLTKPSERLIKSAVRMGLNSAWSPDGKWVAFSARGVNPGAPGFYSPCQPVQIISSSLTEPVTVDGINDPEERQLTLTNADGKKTVVEDCAWHEMSWVPNIKN
jgi:hypothetical protein